MRRRLPFLGWSDNVKQAVEMQDYKKYSLLLTRLFIVFIFLWHGVPKAFNIQWAMDKFVGFGLPGILGPIIGWVEVIAAILVLVGFWHKWANLALAAVIIGAIVTVQLPKGVTAGLERDILILAANLVLATHGPGMLAIENE